MILCSCLTPAIDVTGRVGRARAGATALLARAQDVIPRADVVVISGRVPTGAPVGALGELVRLASGAGRQSVVDTSAQPLIDALRARSTMGQG